VFYAAACLANTTSPRNASTRCDTIATLQFRLGNASAAAPRDAPRQTGALARQANANLKPAAEIPRFVKVTVRG
jgi:hypothetical protein